MDINFKKGSQDDFNTSAFTEGDICFVKQSDSNDYIYRIGTSGAKVGIIGDGYLINSTEFKILKPIINSDNVKIGDMISATAGDSSYEIPSIIGYNATRNGSISNRYLMLDIGNNTSGAIIPNPNKDIDLGFTDARWRRLYLSTFAIKEYSESLPEDILIQQLKSGSVYLKNFNSISPEMGTSISLGDILNTFFEIYTDNLYSYSVEIPGFCYVDDIQALNFNKDSSPVSINLTPSTYTTSTSATFYYPTLRGVNGAGSGKYLVLDVENSSEGYVMPPVENNYICLGHESARWSTVFATYLNLLTPSKGGGVVNHFSPAKTDTYKLGGSAVRWLEGHIKTLSINSGKTDGVSITSDKRLKTVESSDILNFDLRIYDSLEPVCYKYKNILPEDDFSRTHIGFLAQDVAKIIDDIGLTSEECALVWADPLEEDTPQQLKDVCTDGYKYYLNYNELHGLHTLKNHQQDDRLTALEEKNKELENTISELKTQIELFKLAIGG